MIDPEGDQVGILAREKALYLADQLGLDLVEVAPQADPPVSRLMDYGKYKYDQSVKEREARRKQRRHRTSTKEITFRLTISDHDLDTKLRQADEFLAEGDKVKFTIRFRGRERAYPERGVKVLERVAGLLGHRARVTSPPEHAGRTMHMVVAPAPDEGG